MDLPCVFCADKPILLAETPAWCIGSRAPKVSYKSITEVPIQSILEFTRDTRFTLFARLSLTLPEAGQFIAHREAWSQFLTTDAHHGFFFESTQTEIKIPSDLSRDWDVLHFSNTEYLLTRRAASMFLSSSNQIHHNLSKFLTSVPLIKVVFASNHSNIHPL